MPEYLAPGVYVEEVSYRSKSIEGVSTTTTGFVGPTRFGPIDGEPELLTSFTQFERIYGGLDPLIHATEDDFAAGNPLVNYLAHGVRAFFDNGGRRLYVARMTDCLRVVELSLLPEFRGHGIGTQLLKNVQAESMRTQVPVRLAVVMADPVAGFYRRLGFRITSSQGLRHEMEWTPPRPFGS